jgi:hypothetical protein
VVNEGVLRCDLMSSLTNTSLQDLVPPAPTHWAGTQRPHTPQGNQTEAQAVFTVPRVCSIIDVAGKVSQNCSSLAEPNIAWKRSQ